MRAAFYFFVGAIGVEDPPTPQIVRFDPYAGLAFVRDKLKWVMTEGVYDCTWPYIEVHRAGRKDLYILAPSAHLARHIHARMMEEAANVQTRGPGKHWVADTPTYGDYGAALGVNPQNADHGAAPQPSPAPQKPLTQMEKTRLEAKRLIEPGREPPGWTEEAWRSYVLARLERGNPDPVTFARNCLADADHFRKDGGVLGVKEFRPPLTPQLAHRRARAALQRRR